MKNQSAKTKRKKGAQHRLSMFCITLVLIVLGIVVSFAGVSLSQKNKEKKRQQAEIEEQIENEEKKAEEIDKLEEYVGTDEFVEDVAKDKLGLVYPDEIYLKPE